MIKKAWVNNDSQRDDIFMLCIREEPESKAMPFHYSTYLLPPIEPIGDRRLNLDEANKAGIAEKHHIIGVLNRDDLITLFDAIGKALDPSR